MSDGVPPRRFPIVNVLPIVAYFAVFIFYEPPHLNTAVYHASFYPTRQHALPGDLRKNVEDAFGPLLDLVFYFFAGGFVAMRRRPR